MPTYQYACTACAEKIEVVQKFTDDALTICESCGGRLRKVFSAVGIVFKGPGFYRTDSRSSAKETAGAGQKRSGADGAAKPSSEPAAASGSATSNGSSANGSASGASSANGSGSSAKGSGNSGSSSTKVA